jgi:hypothetical protein
MDKKSDVLLRRMLKNWVSRQRPPNNGRARLLWDAARVSRNKTDLSVLVPHPQFKSYPASHSTDWSQILFTWVAENSFQVNIQARLC